MKKKSVKRNREELLAKVIMSFYYRKGWRMRLAHGEMRQQYNMLISFPCHVTLFWSNCVGRSNHFCNLFKSNGKITLYLSKEQFVSQVVGVVSGKRMDIATKGTWSNVQAKVKRESRYSGLISYSYYNRFS